MFLIQFSTAGVGAMVMLPPGQSFNRDLFIDKVLPTITNNMALGRAKSKALEPFLHLDNMRSHLCKDSFEELGIRRLPHPPDCPDLAVRLLAIRLS
jgi:hypothetical protein